jgi:hypothetical protein
MSFIQAINGHANDLPACTWLTVASPSTAGGAIFYSGDSALTSNNYGKDFRAGDSRTWNNGKGMNDVSLQEKYLLGASGSETVLLEWEFT